MFDRFGRGLKLVLAAGLLLVAAPQTALAEKAPIHTGLFSNTALGGYDAVSFFEGTPVAGDKAYTLKWMGADFRFASQDNLEAFKADPERYVPQYGGYCAWAVSQGYTAKGDPKHWKIVDGKLYLNYNGDIQKKWETDISGHIKTADENWPDVLK